MACHSHNEEFMCEYQQSCAIVFFYTHPNCLQRVVQELMDGIMMSALLYRMVCTLSANLPTRGDAGAGGHGKGVACGVLQVRGERERERERVF